jgi:hypothetical protein
VTLNGAPLTSGEVAFVPKEGGGKHRAGIGQLDNEGMFALSSYGNEDGVEAGAYRVIIRPLAEETAGGDKKDAVPVASPIPEMYRSPETSGFEETIDASSKGKIFEYNLK